MSILIKGMEMPKNCWSCPFRKFWDDEDQCLAKKNLWVKDNEIPPVCPLIEIPPHGRLIDADALIKQMTEEGWADGCGWADALDIALAPTIIESEEEK